MNIINIDLTGDTLQFKSLFSKRWLPLSVDGLARIIRSDVKIRIITKDELK